jgi:hypothetical protein
MTVQDKTVYVSDVPIGQASTWDEVHVLLRAKGIWFLGKPAGAEGPTGFFLEGTARHYGQERDRSGIGAA